MNPWLDVKHLFETDDGMLPDIYVENLSGEQIVSAYDWVMSQCSIAHDPTLWSKAKEIDIPIREVQHPARQFVAGNVETFRHCLTGLSVGGVMLPELSVSVEHGGISFDYRAGDGWNEKTVFALFQFLHHLKMLFPNAYIFQADEGCYSSPNVQFAEALLSFEPPPSNYSLQGRRP
jgi:hypothetical protein